MSATRRLYLCSPGNGSSAVLIFFLFYMALLFWDTRKGQTKREKCYQKDMQDGCRIGFNNNGQVNFHIIEDNDFNSIAKREILWWFEYLATCEASEESFGSLAHVRWTIQHIRFLFVDAILFTDVFPWIKGRFILRRFRFSSAYFLIFIRTTHSITIGCLWRSNVHLPGINKKSADKKWIHLKWLTIDNWLEWKRHSGCYHGCL